MGEGPPARTRLSALGMDTGPYFPHQEEVSEAFRQSVIDSIEASGFMEWVDWDQSIFDEAAAPVGAGYPMNARYDLLLRQGEVLDPARGPRAVADVAFRDGRVAAVGPDLDAADASKVLDVSGKLVTPGLIDVHGHYFPHVTHMGISADSVCLPNGVTTTMDAGSSGWVQFDAFKEFILRREKTRLFALINLSSLGMLQQFRDGGYGPSFSISGGPSTGVSREPVGELMDLRYAQVGEGGPVYPGQPQRHPGR